MDAKALVTGGAGFMGSHVARELLGMGARVVILDDLSGGFVENIPDEAQFVHGSITDRELVSNVFKEHRFDHVYHLGAYAAEGLSHFIKNFNYTNNVVGSVNLINASVNHDVRCFVFTSSIAVYGENQLPMREDMTPQPEDSYGIAKYAVELELRASKKMFDLDYVVFRPHNVYGENQNIGDKYRNVVSIFMNQILQGKPLTIFGDGEQTRAFTYVRDIAPIIARAPDVPDALNNVFNLGADTPVTVNVLSRIVARAMAAEPQVIHLETRNEVVHAFSDHSKVREVFGDYRQTPLEEAIPPMAGWVKRMGARKSKAFKNIEVWKNMPPSWREASQAAE